MVAEQLHLVQDPLGASLEPLPMVSSLQALGAIAAALRKPLAAEPAPSWLLPSQIAPFQQLLFILRGHSGALLAEPVGTGKTYIALAVAAALHQAEATQVFAPAALRNQWLRVSKRLGVLVEFTSHELASRGGLPGPLRSLVVIDESHHYRNSSIRRYQNVAPWLRGRTVLLISATPVINQLTDLAAQLSLAVRDDALRAHGCSSFSAALERNRVPAALGELIVSEAGTGGSRPDKVVRRECTGMSASDIDRLQDLDGLVLSRHPGVARLIRWVLYRALASSPAALLASLYRYRSLLLQARDAARAGIAPDRAALRRWAGQLPDQLVLWELVETRGSSADLVTDDLELLEQLIRRVNADSFTPDFRALRLGEILADNHPTLVFTTHRETVSYLRQHLPRNVAWCTGSAAGWRGQRVAREAVLAAFTPGGSPISLGRPPSILVTTDVTAEGLDLQRASRLIHYDLPWTATRMDQREGRVHRLGGVHHSVVVIQFDPPPALERRLAQLSIIERKRDLPRRAGIGEEARAAWTWRGRVASRFGHLPDCGGVARVPHEEKGVVAVVRLKPAGGSGVTALGCWRPRKGWTSNPAVMDGFIQAAARAENSDVAGGPDISRVTGLVNSWIRQMIRRHANGPFPGVCDPWQRRLLIRLRREASLALRHRDARMLEQVDRAMSFVRRGHTAGEIHWLRQIESGENRNLLQTLAYVPPGESPTSAGRPEIISILVFG